MSTVNDIIASKISPALRKLQDVTNKKILGTETKIFRISRASADNRLRGQWTETLETSLIDSVIIQYPSGDIRLNETESGGTLNVDSFDLWDILDITMVTHFAPDTSRDDDAINIKIGDIIVHCMFDEHGNKIPIIMEVKKIIGNFMTRFMTKRKYSLTLYRGDLLTAIQTEIDEYIESLTF